MSIYQIRNINRHFKVLEHDPFQRAIDVGDDALLDRLYNEPLASKGLSDVWVEESVKFTAHYNTSTKTPDISVWGSFLVLTQRAVEALTPYIGSDGEFLPIVIDDEKFQVFNVMSFGEEDKVSTKHEYIDGYPTGLESLKFIESSVTDKWVFKSLMQGCNLLYCDKKLKALCDKNDLRGVYFDLDLLDVFEY
ncbi:conserved hypothetical protein [Vibrio nigripulchritudo SFn27]|uniref:Uncharacterized protein n=1 Tax=Vibrio nigripulchritudo TaxID=28173 RepID=U4K1B2_9VIBR|nr:hypothetical protein [Vibrio nigripulchritudo]CCN80959.1 conserved hypothetical protein [Vibrio nigripulchritudo BLFn1]CCN90993.1 conserved hypothetical protein [Vibrio nigripulchritudo SFn27]CCN97089.1 conserved hypothetical protein [Vibrio nigripulchritudo ENn2]CCO39161.1 conserved hypothetical protein [Vibrio nigripulchritudo SFn135]CCO53249.1 conserved hypothetical protein [Vibrio nigripulchritudo Wn13]